jgi:hypothetical protein
MPCYRSKLPEEGINASGTLCQKMPAPMSRAGRPDYATHKGTVNLAPITTRSHIFQSVSKARSTSIDIENDF